MTSRLDDLPALLPADFFAFNLPLYPTETGELKKRHLLPDLSSLLLEEHFADIWAGYNQKGLFFEIEVRQPFQSAAFPNYLNGDAVELFIDTRDLKTAGFPTRFCHHFLFFPQPVDGVHARELTHFRTEDAHELCDSNALKIETEHTRRKYFLKIFIPTQCLHGYDPTSFKRLGFTYRICRPEGGYQHFNLSSTIYALPAHPSLWSSLTLEDE